MLSVKNLHVSVEGKEILKVIFVKGIIESEQKTTTQNNLTICNYMTSSQLEKTINESQLVVSRSGYTTIMDLAKLEKKAFRCKSKQRAK